MFSLAKYIVARVYAYVNRAAEYFLKFIFLRGEPPRGACRWAAKKWRKKEVRGNFSCRAPRFKRRKDIARRKCCISIFYPAQNHYQAYGRVPLPFAAFVLRESLVIYFVDERRHALHIFRRNKIGQRAGGAAQTVKFGIAPLFDYVARNRRKFFVVWSKPYRKIVACNVAEPVFLHGGRQLGLGEGILSHGVLI